MGAPEHLDAHYYGAPFFGEGIQAWLDKSPIFISHRMPTPVLMYNPLEHPDLWDWFVLLKFSVEKISDPFY